VARLQTLQVSLLKAAVGATRVGGLVAFATCSPHRAETADVVASVISRMDAEIIDARPFLPTVAGLGDGPFIQLWPHRHGTDAMFVAMIRRA
jgi:16S rRNA (cytosine967-C5)-methyltransferase